MLDHTILVDSSPFLTLLAVICCLIFSFAVEELTIRTQPRRPLADARRATYHRYLWELLPILDMCAGIIE